MNKTFDSLVETRDRMALMVVIGVVIVGAATVALYAYASGSLGLFQNLWTSIVIVFFGVAAVAIYVAIDLGIQIKQQKAKPSALRTPFRAFVSLGTVLALVVFAAFAYKHSAIVSHRVALESATKAKASRPSSVDDIIRECKFAKMKGYMDRGYSILQADQAAYLECAANVNKPTQLAQSQASDPEADLLHAAAGVGAYGGGTLHNATALQWAAGSASDRLATSADFVRAVDGASNSADLQMRATELNACMTEAVSGSPPASLSAKDVAAACMVLLGYK